MIIHKFMVQFGNLVQNKVSGFSVVTEMSMEFDPGLRSEGGGTAIWCYCNFVSIKSDLFLSRCAESSYEHI